MNNNEQFNSNPAESSTETKTEAQSETQSKPESKSSVFDRFSSSETGSRTKPEKGLGSRKTEKISQKAKEIIKGAKDKLKSVKVIEAISDRFVILDNEMNRELIEPSRKKFADRETKFEGERQSYEGKETSARKDLENLGNIEGLDMPENMRNKVQKEIDKAERRKNKSEEKRNNAKTEKDELDQKIAGYETKIKEAKGRVADRVQEKRDKYESKIDKQRQEVLLPSMESFAEKQDKIRSLSEVLAKLSVTEVSSPTVEKRRIELIRRTEKSLKKEQKDLGKIKKNLEKVNEKIGKYQTADKKAFEKQLGLLGITEEQYRNDNADKLKEREQRLEPQKERFAAADRKATVSYELSEINSVLNLCLKENSLMMNPEDFKASAENALSYDMTEKELENLVFSSEQALSLFEKANQPIAALSIFKDIIKDAKGRLPEKPVETQQPEQQSENQPESAQGSAESSEQQNPAPENQPDNQGEQNVSSDEQESASKESSAENKPMTSREAIDALNALIGSAWNKDEYIDGNFSILADNLINAADVDRNALGGLAQAANQSAAHGILNAAIAQKVVEVVDAKLKTMEQ